MIGLLTIALSGCATDLGRFHLEPDEISVEEFAHFDCSTLKHRVLDLEKDKLELLNFFKSHNLRLLGGLFGPFMAPLLLTLEGKNGPKSKAYRRLQGEYVALAHLDKRLTCNVPFNQSIN